MRADRQALISWFANLSVPSKRQVSCDLWAEEDSKSFLSLYPRRVPLLSASIDAMEKLIYYQKHGTWSFCDLCGRRRFAVAPAPSIVADRRVYAAQALSRCEKCPLSISELEAETDIPVQTNRLYVVPDEAHWPRWHSGEGRYVLEGAPLLAPSLLALSKEERQSLAPLRLFCDFKSLRGESGRAAVANLRKLSVIRAEWQPRRVSEAVTTPCAKAAHAYLLEHNVAYATYVKQHDELIAQGFPHGRKNTADLVHA